jgi:hypothetical protein
MHRSISCCSAEAGLLQVMVYCQLSAEKRDDRKARLLRAAAPSTGSPRAARLLAYGERVSADAIPPGLLWTASGPITQHLYFWEWARDDHRLYGWLHDADGADGCWRLQASREVLRLYRKIILEVAARRSSLE